MGHRAGISILAALFALISVNVSALGLGDISLKSNLNQPLRAEIELLEVRDLSKAEILVGLATQEDFDRIGVDRVYFLTDLRFDVDLQSKNGPVIRVESKKLVREPYLNFVIIAQWPSGKLLREYTVLMDLPVFAEQAPALVRAPSSSSSNQTSPAARPSSSSSQSSTQANPRSSFEAGRQSGTATSSGYASSGSSSNTNYQSSYSAGDEYTIQRNDTLWEIALAVRPGRDVSVHQAMLALKEANPDAFINNNINLLKRGQILRVPSSDSMKSRGRGQAVNEFAREVNQPSGDEVSAAPLEGRKSYSSYDDSASGSEGRVKLSSPDDASSSASGSSSGSENNTSLKALEGELSSTMEELDKTSRENDELKSKVSALEEQIATMERMIEVSSEDLRALELAAQKSKDDAEAAAKRLAEQETLAAEQAEAAETMLADSEIASEGAETDVDAEVDGSDLDSVVDTEMSGDTADIESTEDADNNVLTDSEDVVTSSADEELAAMEAEQEAARIAAEAEAMEKAKQATPKPAVAQPPAKSKGIFSVIMDNLIYVGLALLALIGLIFFLIKKVFSKDGADDDEDFLEPRAYEEDDFSAESEAELDDAEDLGLMADDEESPDYQEEEFDLDESLAPEEADNEVTADPQTEDVVAEADIYIAYGKYDQAEDMLLKALDSSPTHHEARLKLLETYAAEQNVESFDPQFAIIVATGADDLISRGEHLRSTIADAPTFSTSDYDTSDFEALFANETGESGGDDTVVNFRGNVAADESVDLDSDIDLSDDLSTGLESDLDLGDDLESSLNLDDTVEESADEEEFSLDLDDSFDSSDDNLGMLDENLSDADGDDDSSLSLDLDDSEDFDLGELNLTDDLDDDMEIDIEPSIESESADESTEIHDLEVDLGEIESGFDMDDTEKPSIEEDLTESLDSVDDLSDLDLSDVKDEIASLDEDDTLVLDVDESLKNLAEAGDRSEEAAKAAALSAASLVSDKLESSDTDSVEDDLALDDDLDLSSLDDELKALSQDLDSDLDEDSILKELDDVDLDLDGEDVAGGLDDDFLSGSDEDNDSSLKEPSAVMEEPVTDFDEPESDNDAGDSKSAQDETSSDAELDNDDDFLLPDIDPEGTDEDDLDFLSDSDETATKLDLARAYIDMGDEDGAKDILDEILKEGNDQHKKEAEELMSRIDD